MSVLDTLLQVDWEALGSPALPQWMQDLMAGDKSLRNVAFHNLVAHLAPEDCADCLMSCSEEDRLEVMNRETVFQLIPFLIDMLHNEQTHDERKVTILALIVSLLYWRHAKECLSEPARVDVFYPYMNRLRAGVADGTAIYSELTDSGSRHLQALAREVLEELEIE